MAVLGALLLPVAAMAASATASTPKVLANGTLRVSVTAPAAGTAVVSAVRVTTSSFGVLCATTATFSAAGETQTLLCKPTATAQKIGRNGAYRLRVTLAFTAADGTTATTPLGVVLVPRVPAPPTAPANGLRQLADGSISVLVSSTGPGTAVVTGTNDPGLMCTGRATLATKGSATVICALTSFGVFLHKAGNMFVNVSLEFTPARGATTVTAVGRLLVPMGG